MSDEEINPEESIDITSILEDVYDILIFISIMSMLEEEKEKVQIQIKVW